MKYNVLITCPHLQRTIDHYRQWFQYHDIEIEVPDIVQQLNENQLLEIIDRFDGVIAGDDSFTSNVLRKGKKLKTLAKWGIGLDAIALDTAQELGISVTNTPDVFADEIADVVIGYLIMLTRGLHLMDQSVRQGGWLKVQGRSLKGKTLGVIGVGSIGSAVVERGKVMGMSIVGYDVKPISSELINKTGLKQLDLEELLKVADVISLNCNLNQNNYHLLSEKQFNLIKEGAYLINTGRGALIDESALIKALEENKLGGVALDVFENEPLLLDHPLHQFDNCIFGTHNASNTLEAVMRVNDMAINNLWKYLQDD